MQGQAPGTEIFAYRVFGQGQPRATNYSIAKAIDRALAHGCDIVNLSLGGRDLDVATQAAIDVALERGCVVIAAAGNDGRRPVSYPAAVKGAIAVTALGRIGAFPVDSVDTAEIGMPPGQDPNDFIALFSNIGPQVALTAPGVGIVSTLPPDRYGVMSGTSMACPAVSGFAARLLARDATLLGATRDLNRSGTLTSALIASARALPFGPYFEGQGLPR
jgi:subtilisin